MPKLGAKAFEQCAGFLRVRESAESAGRDRRSSGELFRGENAAAKCFPAIPTRSKKAAFAIFPATCKRIRAGRAGAKALNVGVPTLQDILSELQKPGRDPREDLPAPVLSASVMEMSDLKPGMELTGTVRNVVDFGAFVDIGVHQDGLVHLSRMANRFIRHPNEVVKVGDVIKVWVVEVDEKKRIALTMLKPD